MMIAWRLFGSVTAVTALVLALAVVAGLVPVR
jgi:hypothetical protein